MNPKNCPLIEIKNLTIEFKTDNGVYRAVEDISLVVGEGKILGIVGESGSGKSVSSLSIMGLIPCPPGKIASGEILFTQNNKTKNLLLLSENQKCNYRGNEIAMIFQEPMTALNPVYKCGKQVVEAILLHRKISSKEAREKTIALFNEVMLPNPERIFNAYPHELSGGQKQRVMIAMAISCNPALLIADEPTTALDVTVQKTILELLKSLQQSRGMSMIFITHDLGVVSEIADDVVVMHKGKIVEQGTKNELFNNPIHPYTKGLMSCRPPTDKRVKKLTTVADFLERPDFADKIDTISLSESTEERTTRLALIYAQAPVLQVKNIVTTYEEKQGFLKKSKFNKSVDDVSFDVYPSETLGLVGESGCGKTTLGKTILQLISATSGQIIYKNTDLTKLSAREMKLLRKNIQIIFQDPYSSLNPRLTVGMAITEPMYVHKIGTNDKDRKRIAIELLERVNLNESHFYRYPHEFSGGQRQRICIARALALHPEFIICDESVSALDVSVQAQVLNLLNELKRDFGFTYIFISHDLNVVKFMSDRLIVMYKGKIEEMGDADAIYKNPQSEYTRKLINTIPKIDVREV